MAQAAAATLALRASDVSGQRTIKVSAVSPHATIGELVGGLLARLGLARSDADGRPMLWRARLDREGRHLNGAELVGDALQEDDHVTLQPDISAGRR
jgi:hypothetical protein